MWFIVSLICRWCCLRRENSAKLCEAQAEGEAPKAIATWLTTICFLPKLGKVEDEVERLCTKARRSVEHEHNSASSIKIYIRTLTTNRWGKVTVHRRFLNMHLKLRKHRRRSLSHWLQFRIEITSKPVSRHMKGAKIVCGTAHGRFRCDRLDARVPSIRSISCCSRS